MCQVHGQASEYTNEQGFSSSAYFTVFSGSGPGWTHSSPAHPNCTRICDSEFRPEMLVSFLSLEHKGYGRRELLQGIEASHWTRRNMLGWKKLCLVNWTEQWGLVMDSCALALNSWGKFSLQQSHNSIYHLFPGKEKQLQLHLPTY